MPTPETLAKAAIRQALARSGKCLIFNNPVGFDELRQIRFGLSVGSSDPIGVCSPNGRFFAVEVKSARGSSTPEQRAFLYAINKAGGYGCIARTPEQALEHLEKATAGVEAPAVRNPSNIPATRKQINNRTK